MQENPENLIDSIKKDKVVLWIKTTRFWDNWQNGENHCFNGGCCKALVELVGHLEDRKRLTPIVCTAIALSIPCRDVDKECSNAQLYILKERFEATYPLKATNLEKIEIEVALGAKVVAAIQTALSSFDKAIQSFTEVVTLNQSLKHA
ncbi:MAG: hypothetical protein A3H06_01245 [Candidatus Colwellbacteria bacterium RIFCSPLOWO2_12_FULL_44_13]|uniref:Uncharacterized protein n=2 Tax=Candidatus Colwelliibacteriota TaxID=1817904 RepID=A0A1G1Z6L1_9BACT|nr:MAG: hypothetical protein A3I31_03005 [Candidatus Colwellbacteria bacterium RIFCSPLOWO2_02_FULL_44_20b]OGY61460.1 MAG: hypothetical protein A3H06_01245 [Candidatus Colwellbacteria bacterium RIFCSPLOWO2_12_FULL_44_13]